MMCDKMLHVRRHAVHAAIRQLICAFRITLLLVGQWYPHIRHIRKRRSLPNNGDASLIWYATGVFILFPPKIRESNRAPIYLIRSHRTHSTRHNLTTILSFAQYIKLCWRVQHRWHRGNQTFARSFVFVSLLCNLLPNLKLAKRFCQMFILLLLGILCKLWCPQ